MLSVFLYILKIIGIVLLCVLGLLLLLVLLILFAPIRYRIKGQFYDKSPKLDGKITWFIPGLRCLISFHDKLDISVKLFGFRLYPKSELSPEKTAKLAEKQVKKAKKEERKISKKAALETDVSHLVKAESEHILEEDLNDGAFEKVESDEAAKKNVPKLEQEADEAAKENVPKLEQEAKEQVFYKESEKDAEDEHDPNASKKKSIMERCADFFRTIFAKIQSFFHKLIGFFDNIRLTFSKICDKIGGVKNKIGYYYDLWQKDATKKVFEDCKGRLVKLFKHLRPKKFSVEIHVGMEDPSTTGMIMGIWGILYPIFGGMIFINPEFDNEVLEGDLILKGKIRIIHVVVVALQFYRDKRLKKLLELVKKGGK